MSSQSFSPYCSPPFLLSNKTREAEAGRETGATKGGAPLSQENYTIQLEEIQAHYMSFFELLLFFDLFIKLKMDCLEEDSPFCTAYQNYHLKRVEEVKKGIFIFCYIN